MKIFTVKKGTILIDKICTKCKILESHTSGGKHCRKCVSINSKKHIDLNREHRKGYYTKWRGENYEGLKVTKKKYYEEVKKSEEYINYWKEYRKTHKNSEKNKNYRYQKEYGITLDNYNQMCIDQNNSCDICKKPSVELGKILCVDHCHTTSKVRGLLCHNCNISLGLVNDNIYILKSAIIYLEKHK